MELIYLYCTGQETDIQVVEHTVTSLLLVAELCKGEEMEARHPGTTRRDKRVSSGTVLQKVLLVTDISNFLRSNRNTLNSRTESANGFKLTTRNVFHTHKHILGAK